MEDLTIRKQGEYSSYEQLISDLSGGTKAVDEKLTQFLQIQMTINDLLNGDLDTVLSKYLQQQKFCRMLTKCVKKLWLALACNTVAIIILLIAMIVH